MSEQVLDFTPVDFGDLTQIPPDAPAGSWDGICAVKKSKTRQEGFPMLVLTWKLVKAHEEDNAWAEGKEVADFLTFFPKAHRAFKMNVQKLHILCESLHIEKPTATSMASWDDMKDFIDEIDGRSAPVYTTIAPDKRNGNLATSIQYSPPRGMVKPGFIDADNDVSDVPPVVIPDVPVRAKKKK